MPLGGNGLPECGDDRQGGDGAVCGASTMRRYRDRMEIEWGSVWTAVLPIITLIIGTRITSQTDRARYRLEAGDALARLEPLIWRKYSDPLAWQDLRTHMGSTYVRLRLAGVPVEDIKALDKAVVWAWATVYDTGSEEAGLGIGDQAYDLFEGRREVALSYLEPRWHVSERCRGKSKAEALDKARPEMSRRKALGS